MMIDLFCIFDFLHALLGTHLLLKESLVPSNYIIENREKPFPGYTLVIISQCKTR